MTLALTCAKCEPVELGAPVDCQGLGGSAVAMALARRVRPVRSLCGSNGLGYR